MGGVLRALGRDGVVGPPVLLEHQAHVPSSSRPALLRCSGKVEHAFTAHPKLDPETGELFYFGYSVEKKPYCEWFSRRLEQGAPCAC